MIVNQIVQGGGGGGGGSDTLTIKPMSSGANALKGIYPNVNRVEFDMDNKSQTLPGCSYSAFKTTDAEIVYKNISSTATAAQMAIGDFARQMPCVKKVDFGGAAPSGITRWFYQWNYSQDGNTHSGAVTVENLCLDNLSSNNTGFNAPSTSSQYYHNFDVYFTGHLRNDINLTSWTLLNSASWNRLIDCLYDYSGGTAHTLTVGSTIIGMIDSTHQATAQARNWTLA